FGFEAVFKHCPQTLVVNNICFLQMSDRKAVIKNADMSEDMQQDAVEISTQAMEKFNIEKDIAAYVKKEFDKKYNPTWHCIVGRNFGSYVTHETKHFIYFYLGQVAVLLFKSEVSVAKICRSCGKLFLDRMTDRKAVIKNADMTEDMQQDAVECATQAMEKFNIEKDIAAYIKKEFDKKYNPTWHCIVGRNFGSYVTHETKHFIYFYLGQVAVLLFKSG
ncbi:Dynein light chain 2, partial [Acropora cervicornis]